MFSKHIFPATTGLFVLADKDAWANFSEATD